MKKSVIILIASVLLFAGCTTQKAEPDKCWEEVYSEKVFAFVITMVNLCNGKTKTTVITPIKKYIDRMEKKGDRLRKEALGKKEFKGSA